MRIVIIFEANQACPLIMSVAAVHDLRSGAFR